MHTHHATGVEIVPLPTSVVMNNGSNGRVIP